MWLGFGFGAGTVLAGVGEGITLGGDTPFTLTFGSLTTFFGTTSALTGGTRELGDRRDVYGFIFAC